MPIAVSHVALLLLVQAGAAFFTLGFSRRPVLSERRVSPFISSLFNADGNSRATHNNVTKERRFERVADSDSSLWKPCILTIDGVTYNLTAWARAHPGGVDALRSFHDEDATEAFRAAGHSPEAYELLATFADRNATDGQCGAIAVPNNSFWLRKLFTKEDPIGLHKYSGIFALLHLSFRFWQMFFGDFSAGYGSCNGKGPRLSAALCLVPHMILSVSSLSFQTVPRERVVGKPMIWQEFRVHNILFAMRSIITTFLAWLSIYCGHGTPWRRLAVVGSCGVTLAASLAADEASSRLRSNRNESTTATMPYWRDCSVKTQRRFKIFYAFSQFQATATCMAVGNPAWTLSLLLPIQLASFLMTLVRKGIISPKGYHLAYSLSLALPYFVGLRSMLYMKNIDFPIFLCTSALLFSLRCRGVSKFALWVPFALARIFLGDAILHYDRPW